MSADADSYFECQINGHAIKGRCWQGESLHWHGHVTVDGVDAREMTFVPNEEDAYAWCVETVLELADQFDETLTAKG